jgi:hypothetical protein
VGRLRSSVCRLLWPLHRRDGGLIHQVTYHDHNGDHDVDGKAFVDASGDCDLAFFAGASTRYGNHGFINLGTLGTRFGGIKSGADLDANAWTAVIRRARSNGVAPLSKDRSLVMRVPLSNDVIAYLASEVYDVHDARSISRAEIRGRQQAWAYLGARLDDSIALGAWGAEFHCAESMDSAFKLPGGNGVYEIPLGAVTSVDTANLFAAGGPHRRWRSDGRRLAARHGHRLRHGSACGVAAARCAQKADSLVAEIQSALREQRALIDGDDLPEPVALQHS